MEGRGRRVAVTGLGVVAPCGIGAEAFWNGLLGPGITTGRSVGIPDWDPSPWYDTPKDARRADRVEQFATAAATEAMATAGEVGVDPARFGTIFATGIGGLETLEEQIALRLEKGERRVSPFLVPMIMVNASGDLAARWLAGTERDDLHGVRGRHARHRLRRPPDRVGSLRRGRHGRFRGGRHVHVARRLRQHDGTHLVRDVAALRRQARRLR